MNKLKETQIISTQISSSFHKNVSLLTKIILPSVEFQRLFKKGMFDKPNMTGFLHVSHYLSTIYDAKLFKQMVRWPILCRRDEVTYRIEIKNFLCLLSRDNPDLNFPTILMSYLIQSAGIKFQIIMWKLSQLALRAYIQRELQTELLNAPCAGPAQDLTIAYFNNTIVQKCNVILKTCKKTEKILDATKIFFNGEMKALNAYKSEIFDRKENIKTLVLDLPAYSLLQKRLIDVEDFDIISIWKRSIFKRVQYIQKKNKELNKLEESCDCLCKLVLRINLNSGTLSANKFPKIYCNNYYLIYMQSETQCLPFVQNACKKMKSLQILFNALNVRISSMYRNEQYVSREMENVYINFDASKVSIVSRNISLQSPKISFILNQHTNNDLFYERLSSSPIEGKYKHLFKRYKREYRPLCELPTLLLDFSNSWNSMSGWLSPRAHSVKCEQISYKGKSLSPLYSRLLRHSRLDLKRSKESVLLNPNANYEGLNLTPRKRLSRARHLTTHSCSRRIKDGF
ncbi:uncharacterized protein LOC105201520 isoform X2 [Solenopsis invicta]|uniref:uncharacterized protein LOC105201520 isoform X2 n=1 Tax=Solenopsis invicta TaxID=13686 RepID=UPI00193EA826|nr:uncharacterized protein LOC105201520 isoform X2 [Solenopsis invicta]